MIVADRSQWLPDWSQPVLDMTAGDALRRAARLAPDRVAIIEAVPDGMGSLTGAAATDRRWTFAALLADAEACARWLVTRFEPGSRICIWAPNVPEWVIVQFGAALAGLTLVTANPSLRAKELAHVLTRSGAAGLFLTRSFRGTDMMAIAAATGFAGTSVALDELAALIAEQDGVTVLPVVDPSTAAQMQFTSGTTGRPKGALLRHRSLVTNAALTARRFGIEADIVVTPMPLFHTAGSVLGVLGGIVTLSTTVLLVMFDARLMLRAMAAERATAAYGVPTMLVGLLEERARGDYDLSALRSLHSGGAPVPSELLTRVEKAFGCELYSLYGQTELSPTVCATGPGDAAEDRAGGSGRPLAQSEVRIVDPVTRTAMPLGASGECEVRGYQTMIGYHDQPADTARTLSDDGWMRTGDLAKMDGRGHIRITGRISDMIIRGGENIYPAEIEAVLLQHPALAQVAVFGMTDARWGEVVAAAVQPVHGQALPTVATLHDHCRTLLSPQKTPSAWFHVTAFPLTSSGKVQKFMLVEWADAGALGLTMLH